MKNASTMDTTLKERLQGKSVLIWGARIVGIGLQRACRKDGIEVVGFIDSDPALRGRSINGCYVFAPDQRESIKDLCIGREVTVVLAVSIKEDEVRLQLSSLLGDGSGLDVISYKSYSNMYYTIDISGACNLKCMSCAHSIEDHDTPLGLMSIENVKAVLAKMKVESPSATHASLYSWGEPLIHPQIDQIINLFHEEGMAVGVSTNLSHEDFGKILKTLRASPDYLKISLSGYYPEAYDNTHQGGDITLVKSNLYRLRYYLDKLRLDTLVDVNYHLYKDNCGDNLSMMRSLTNELGFALSTVHALVMPLERVINKLEGNPDIQTLKLEENMLVGIEEGIRASESVELSNGCPFMENQMNINADLTVPVCCLVFNRDHVVAENYLESSIDEIQESKHRADICKKCMSLNLPQYNMGFNKEAWERIAGAKEVKDVGMQA